MDLKKAFKKVSEKPEFKSQKGYLSHACFIEEKNKDNSWEFGIFNPETKKITVFESEPYKVREPDDALTEKDVVEELNFDLVKISYPKALEIANAEAIKKNAKLIQKKIIILQKDKNLIWNITFLTADFNLMNIKVDAVSGEVLSVDFHNLYDLGL